MIRAIKNKLIRVIKGFAIICSIFVFIQCDKEQVSAPAPGYPEPQEIIDTNMVKLTVDSCILIPTGQLNHTGSSVNIFIDGQHYVYDTLDDGLGGYWAILPNIAFTNISELKIRVTRRNSEFQLQELSNDSTSAYLKDSKLIDWDEVGIKIAARDLFNNDKSISENALAIQNFVVNHIDFDQSYADYFGGFMASHTYYQKKGVCINYSRLFIALCRASGIRARSVSGVIFNPGPAGTDCFHHHQWCEFVDENNLWRSIDLTYTTDLDISNIHYIDFTYCAEETEIFADYYDEFMEDPGKPFKTDNECVVIYCYLPTIKGARFGFQLLEDNRPDSIIFEKTLSIRKVNDVIITNNLVND